MFATGRIALAASAPAPTLPLAAVRSEAGQSYVWTIDGGKLARRIVITGRRDETNGRVEIKTALPRETAGARRALRQPEGRRAGARQGGHVVAERDARDRPAAQR